MLEGTYFKPKFFDFMLTEYLGCREGAGNIDMSSFSKIEIKININVIKEYGYNSSGHLELMSGFTIVGGIDQDYRLSTHGYQDNFIYVTQIDEHGPAWKAGLQVHDKIVKCNGTNFTLVSQIFALEFMKEHPALEMLVERKIPVPIITQ